MNVEIEFENYNIKSPKMPDPFNVNLINAVGSGGGGGGGNEVELTWAEYEALSEAEKMNGTNYFITDINTTKSLTSKVLFDGIVEANTTYNFTDSILNYDFIKAIVLPSSTTRYACPVYFSNNDLLQVVGNSHNDFLIGFNQSTNTAMQVLSTIPTSTTFKPYLVYSVNLGSSTPHVIITGYIYQRVVVPNQMINYSTIETKIGTWIDGKPLYQKTITGRMPSSSYDYFGDVIENFERCYYYEGMVVPDDTNSAAYSIFYNRPDNNNAEYYVGIEKTGKVFIRTYSSQASTFYVTIRYTKTTD